MLSHNRAMWNPCRTHGPAGGRHCYHGRVLQGLVHLALQPGLRGRWRRRSGAAVAALEAAAGAALAVAPPPGPAGEHSPAY